MRTIAKALTFIVKAKIEFFLESHRLHEIVGDLFLPLLHMPKLSLKVEDLRWIPNIGVHLSNCIPNIFCRRQEMVSFLMVGCIEFTSQVVTMEFLDAHFYREAISVEAGFDVAPVR